MSLLPWKIEEPATVEIPGLPGVEVPDYHGLTTNETALLMKLQDLDWSSVEATEIVVAYCLAARLNHAEQAKTIFSAVARGKKPPASVLDEFLPPQPRVWKKINDIFSIFSPRNAAAEDSETEGNESP
ncbi:MAG: hypothetical protein AAGJ95_16255 [Cyanobacteria bacterium J06554_11]